MLTLRFIIFTLLSFTIFTSNAISTTADAVKSEDNNSSSHVEIITVTGSRSLDFFRSQLKQTEREFYQALNELTDLEEFKIECGIKKNSFSNVTNQVCQPKYVEMVKVGLTQDSFSRGSSRIGIHQKVQNLPSRRMIERKIAKKRQEHLDIVKALVEANPKLQATLLDLNKAKHSFEKKKAEVFGQQWVSQEATDYMAKTKEFVE